MPAVLTAEYYHFCTGFQVMFVMFMHFNNSKFFCASSRCVAIFCGTKFFGDYAVISPNRFGNRLPHRT